MAMSNVVVFIFHKILLSLANLSILLPSTKDARIRPRTSHAGAIKNENCATGDIDQRRVRTASGSDRILRQLSINTYFVRYFLIRSLPAPGSDTIRGDSHI